MTLRERVMKALRESISQGHAEMDDCVRRGSLSPSFNSIAVEAAVFTAFEEHEEEAKVPRCAACGLAFDVNEFRSGMPDGTFLHEDTQPASMRKCRDELLRQMGR
jgi:hypothetical protein